MTKEEALDLALEALEWNMDYLPSQGRGTSMARDAITAIKQAQTQTVQEPVARQYQGRNGVWNDFISEKHYKDTLADGSWPIRNLYTDPPALSFGEFRAKCHL